MLDRLSFRQIHRILGDVGREVGYALGFPRPLVDRVTNANGGTVVKIHPQVWKHATKPATAAAINLMMQGVVQSGTGTAAQIPGVKVAGKTGTAETGAKNVYTAWFIFFAPADNPQVAGAVVLEHQLNGFGGSVSAPIAKQLMQALLPQASKP